MSSLEAYCQRLKDLASQLQDVDCPVAPNRLVLQLVRGLPPEFDTVAAYINQTLPPWDTAYSMLQLEHQRQRARDAILPNEVAATIAQEPPPPRRDAQPNRGRQTQRNPPWRNNTPQNRSNNRPNQPPVRSNNLQPNNPRQRRNTLGQQRPPWSAYPPPPYWSNP